MVISSRTPDGWPNECPICGHSILILPSPNTLDAPCPHCGHLLWFTDGALVPIWTSSQRAATTQSYEIPDAIVIEDHVVELMPQSVARENLVIPIAESVDALLIAAATPIDRGTIDKLQFILHRRVLAVPTNREWIVQQIDKYYGTNDGADAA